MTAAGLESDLVELGNRSRLAPFDAIVVGAGSSGLTVTATLREAGATVALLEAGPAPFLGHITNTDLRFARQLSRNLRDATAYCPPLASGGTFGVNFSCFGGRGLFWNGAAPRYSRADFSGWPADGLPEEGDWTWAEHQFRVSTALGRTPMAGRLIDMLQAAGFAAEPGPFAVDVDDLYTGRLSSGVASGLGLFFRTCGDGVPQGNPAVAVNCRVNTLLLGPDGDVKGVAAAKSADPAAQPIEILSRAVVLCGGSIESANLAAVSGVRDPHARIGKGVQEHLFYHALLNGSALYDPGSPSSAVIYVRSPSQEGHQWELHAPGNRLLAVDDGTGWLPTDTAPYEIMVRAFAATEKRDENCLEPAPGPLGSSIVHFTRSAADLAGMARMAEDADRLANALGARANAAPPLASSDRIRPPGASYHEAGGLDMGQDEATSVTGPDGCFHAAPSLVCADAAAFPWIGATNPHLTIVAVARRKARQLAARLAKP